MISTKIHAFLDYLVGLILIIAPWVVGFSQNMPATAAIVTVGILTLSYSLFTDYEFSLLPILPFPIHLMIDFVSGVFLICAPWLFGFYQIINWPFVVIGVFEILAVFLSKKSSKKRSRLRR